MSNIIQFEDHLVDLNQLVKLARLEGITIVKGHLENCSFLLSIHCEKLQIIFNQCLNKAEKVILIDESDFDFQQRVYIAYALAVHQLIKDNPDYYNGYYYIQKRQEFLLEELLEEAANILIPDQGFKARLSIASKKENPIEYLTDCYQVDEQLIMLKKQTYDRKKSYQKRKR